jgi:hypothetical protein
LAGVPVSEEVAVVLIETVTGRPEEIRFLRKNLIEPGLFDDIGGFSNAIQQTQSQHGALLA